MKSSNEPTKPKKDIWVISAIVIWSLVGILFWVFGGIYLDNQNKQSTNTQVFLTATPSQSQLLETQLASYKATLTMEAFNLLPTNIPAPTAIPVYRSPQEIEFDKCVNSKGVKYVISGDQSAKTISLTLQNDIGGTEQLRTGYIYCRIFTKFDTRDFLYISGQLTDGYGSVQCLIYDGNKLLAKANSSGFASIVTCSASK